MFPFCICVPVCVRVQVTAACPKQIKDVKRICDQQCRNLLRVRCHRFISDANRQGGN